MPNASLQSLSPLALAAAGLLLGCGGRAQADYIPSATPQFLSQADFFPDAYPQVGGDDLVASSAPVASAAETHLRADDGPASLPTSQGLAAWQNRGEASSGAGCQTPHDRPGGDGPTQPVSAPRRPQADAPAPAAGVLFLEATRQGPPPFPSRLFRPPRRAWL